MQINRSTFHVKVSKVVIQIFLNRYKYEYKYKWYEYTLPMIQIWILLNEGFWVRSNSRDAARSKLWLKADDAFVVLKGLISMFRCQCKHALIHNFHILFLRNYSHTIFHEWCDFNHSLMNVNLLKAIVTLTVWRYIHWRTPAKWTLGSGLLSIVQSVRLHTLSECPLEI